MGSLLVCWVLFPVLLGVLSLGCGCALELATGRRLDDGILIPAGFAALIALACLPLLAAGLATLIVPVVVAVAIVGLLVGQPRRRPVGAAVIVGSIVLLVHGAPVVLSGEPGILGYFKLDDSASSLAFVDRLMQHGRDFSGLAPSSYEATLFGLFQGYPAGPLLPIGIGHELLAQDVVWLFQPSLAFEGAMLGMALWAMTGPLVRGAWRRGFIAVIAAQPSLLIGYEWWGGIKEIATAPLVATAAVLAGAAMRGPVTVRQLLPLAVVVAAVLDVVSMGGVVWALPPLVPLAVLLVRRGRGLRAWARRSWTDIAVAAGVAVALLLPALTTFNTFRHFGSESFSGAHAEEVARLFGRLYVLKGFGIWPSGDFRTPSVDAGVTHLLIAVLVIAAVAGAAWAWQRRAWELLSYASACAISGVVLNLAAGPWIAGKALAIASPGAPLLALVAVAVAFERGWRLEAGLVGAALVAGVVWSNVLQYHSVQITPHTQFVELAHIGDLAAGEGPTLITEYNPYAARHFLRRADGESASELRRRSVTLRTGALPARGTAPDTDEIALRDLMLYQSIVLRSGPAISRPPAPYRLAWRGHFYELWQRPPGDSPVLAHLPLGQGLRPAEVPSCRDVLALARTAGARRIAAAQRDLPVSFVAGPLPSGWSADQNGVVLPHRAGVLSVSATLSRPGRYTVWVGGSFRAGLRVSVDGRRVGDERHELDEAGAYVDMGTAMLTPGTHRVALDYSGPDLHPGSSGAPFGMGPVVLTDQTTDLPVISVAPSRARTLCGQRLDWVEALAT